MNDLHVAVVNLTGGGLSGGYRKYLRELMPSLRRQPGIGRISMLSPAAAAGSISDGLADEQWTWSSGDVRFGFRRVHARICALEPDVVFFPTARMLRTGKPTVVMVRNMEPLVAARQGHSLGGALRNFGRRIAARSSCRHADRIIAVSDFVRDFLIETWQLEPERVATVYHGVNGAPAAGSRRPPGLELQAGASWIFTAGSIRPARGLTDAVEALAFLRRQNREVALVIAGSVDADCTHYHTSVRRLAMEHGVSNHIIWTGPLDDGEMRWCLENCTQFVMTSRTEACPNTALEAMNAGAVCVSTDSPPMPEFFQSAALYYSAGAGASLGQRILELLNAGTSFHAELRLRARQRAADFTWERTAARTAAELVACVDQRHRSRYASTDRVSLHANPIL